MQYLTVGQSEKIDAIRQTSYFSGLDDALVARLSSGASLRSYERGEVLFWAGDPCAGLYIIHRGIVKLFKTSLQGRELIINVFEEGTTFNEVPVFDSGLNPVNAAALDDCEVWVIEATVIRAAMESDPAMCRAVIANLSSNLRMLVAV
jgi:CRP-like cAMP-binding protein